MPSVGRVVLHLIEFLPQLVEMQSILAGEVYLGYDSSISGDRVVSVAEQHGRGKKGVIMSLRVFVSILGCILAAASGLRAAGSDSISAQGGEIRITPILHGSVQLEFGDTVIYVDPWSQGDYAGAPPADLILVTDVHGDHLDTEMIDKLSQESTEVVVAAAVAEKLGSGTVMANGDSQTIAGVSIEAVPMYNLERGPEAGKLYHEKGRGNGYIVTLGGKRIYLAGDTACTPEMKALTDIDVAFVPMNLPYTMPPEEAAECVATFKPKIVYPYHYRGSDLQVFSAGLEDVPEVEVRLREWYPGS